MVDKASDQSNERGRTNTILFRIGFDFILFSEIADMVREMPALKGRSGTRVLRLMDAQAMKFFLLFVLPSSSFPRLISSFLFLTFLKTFLSVDSTQSIMEFFTA